MLPLSLARNAAAPLRILCLGSHSDDIEIGCGATILRIQQEYPNCLFHWVVFSAEGVRAEEARQGATLFVSTSALAGLAVKAFRDGLFPAAVAEVKSVFEELKRSVSPDIILTHNRGDAHQDHRVLAEMTWNTFRDHLILEYEIPKYDGDLGQPNFFVPVSREICQKKVQLIMDTFQSQHSRRWFHPDTFSALMRLRGVECNAADCYAEAFYCRKMVL